MALRPGDEASFWRTSDPTGIILAERRRWLAQSPELYTALLPEGADSAHEALQHMAAMSGQRGLTIEDAAALLEPDWVILDADARVLGGAVIFPSSWSLPEKLGLPLSEVHGPVPSLQASLGRSIATFLNRLEARVAWERDNWGFSADAELNHHPSRPLPSLTNSATLHTTWLRFERQFLTRLPATQAILFGIRVTNHRLDDLAALPGMASRFALTLETMEDDVALYKGLHEARATLAAQLRAFTADETGSAP